MGEAWLRKEPTERTGVTRKRDARTHDVVGDGMSRRPDEWNGEACRVVRGAAGVRARIVPQRRGAAKSAESKAAPREGRAGRWMWTGSDEAQKASSVLARAVQGAEAHWWVEALVWTGRMVSALATASEQNVVP